MPYGTVTPCTVRSALAGSTPGRAARPAWLGVTRPARPEPPGAARRGPAPSRPAGSVGPFGGASARTPWPAATSWAARGGVAGGADRLNRA